MSKKLDRNSCICLLFLSLLGTSNLIAQSDALSLANGTAAPGASVSIPLSLTNSGGAQATALEWTFSYSPSDITAVSVVVAGTASSAGKSVDCASDAAGAYVCLIYGMNSTAIANGTVATATFTVSASTSSPSSAIGVVSTASSSAIGEPISSTGSGGTITIPHTGPTLKGLSCAPSTVQTPGTTMCTVTLTSAAPAGGFTVSIGYSTSSGAQVTVPASVTVPAGSSTYNFSAQIGSVTSKSSVRFTASQGSTTVSFAVTITPPALPSVSGTISPASLGSGATIKLSGAATAITTADSGGNYSFAGLANGSYTVTPSKSGVGFNPTKQTVKVAGTNITGVNFTARSRKH